LPVFKKKHNNSIPELDASRASETLKDVFAAANVRPNDIPMETLSSKWRKPQGEPLVYQRAAVIVAMVFFLILPILFVVPQFTVTTTEDGVDGYFQYNIQLNTILPVKEVLATVDGESLDVSKKGNRRYEIKPKTTGELELTVTLFNNQRTRQRIQVATKDGDDPLLLKCDTDSNNVSLYVKDKDCGVNLKEAYAVDDKGRKTRPEVLSNEEGKLIFPYPAKSMVIYVPDNLNNYMQLTMDVS
jgi:hypothetical protein